MTQTLLATSLTSAFSRFCAWILALRENDLPREKPSGRDTIHDESERNRDDVFYLALGMNGHW